VPDVGPGQIYIGRYDMNFSWVLPAAAALIVVAGALVVIGKGVRWVFATLNMVREFLEDWRGEDARPGYHKRPGVMERLVSLEEQVKAANHERKPNSGLSLRDAVDRIEVHTVPPPETREAVR
jgi:hypothetical protein